MINEILFMKIFYKYRKTGILELDEIKTKAELEFIDEIITDYLTAKYGIKNYFNKDVPFDEYLFNQFLMWTMTNEESIRTGRIIVEKYSELLQNE